MTDNEDEAWEEFDRHPTDHDQEIERMEMEWMRHAARLNGCLAATTIIIIIAWVWLIIRLLT